jgi:hypothetical protein
VLSAHKHSPKQNYKLYSDIVAGRKEKIFTLTFRTKHNYIPEEIIRELKVKVNPAKIKIGITSLKTLRDGRVVAEASSGIEINLLGDKIRKGCAKTLAVNIQTIKKQE